jgi:large repetitive protein
VNEGVGVSVAISGLSIDDVDAGTLPVRLTLSIPAGTGSLQVATGIAGVTITGNDSTSIVLVGPLAQINAILAHATGVTYTVPDGDFNNVRNNNQDVILTTVVNDLGNTGDGPYANGIDVTATVPITVRPVNDAPTASLTIPTRLLSEGLGNSVLITDLRVADVDVAEGDGMLVLTLEIPAAPDD